MTDDTAILRAAEHDLAQARRLFGEHLLDCGELGCDDCMSLRAHLRRTREQVGLLAAAVAEPEGLF
jgi:hypothetical protein